MADCAIPFFKNGKFFQYYNSVKKFSEREIRNGERMISVFQKITQLNSNVIQQNTSAWLMHDATGKTRMMKFEDD
jgi:hypothetical protein